MQDDTRSPTISNTTSLPKQTTDMISNLNKLEQIQHFATGCCGGLTFPSIPFGIMAGIQKMV